MIRQDQAGGVQLASTLFRRKTTASIPKSVTRLFNKANLHDVFNIDNGDDSEDLMIIDDKASKSNKGNTIETTHQVANASDDADCQLSVENFGQITAIESYNGYPMVSHNSIIVGHGSIISCEDGDDSEDLVILGEKVSKSNKGKAIEAVHQIVEVSDNNLCQSGVEKFRTVTATKTSNDYPLVSNDIINIDCHGSDLSYGDGYDSKELVIIGEEVSKSNKGKQIEAPHQVLLSIEHFGPTSGIESSNGSPLVYLPYGDGDDSDDLMIIGEEVNKSINGKTIETIHQEVSDYTFSQPAVKSFGSVAKDVIDIDDDDDSDDLTIIGEDVSKSNKGKKIEVIPEVVAHSDNIDVPSRIEVPLTFFRESDNVLRGSTFESSTSHDTQSAATNINTTYKPPASTNFERATKASSVYNSSSMNQAPFTSFRDSGIGLRSTFESSTLYGTQSEATNSYLKASSQPSRTLERGNSKNQGSTMGSSSLQNKVYNIFDSMGIQFSSSILYQATPNKRKSTAPSTSANSKSAKKARFNSVDTDYDYDYDDGYDYDDDYDDDDDDDDDYDDGYDYDDTYDSTSTYQYTSNKRSTAPTPTTSANFRSTKAYLNNFGISYESNLGSRKSRRQSSTWYDTQSYGTQSIATNSYSKASCRSSRLLEPANSKIHGSTTRSSNLQIKMDNKKKSAAPQSVSNTKKAASSMRLLDAPKPSGGKKAVGIGSKNSHATSSSKPSQLLALGAPTSLITASKASAATKTVSGKKAAGSGSKKSQATSSSNPSLPLLDSSAHMSSSLFSKSVSSKKKADAPMMLLPAPKPSATNKIITGKKAAGSGSKKSQATSSSKPSQSLNSGALMGSSLFKKPSRSFNSGATSMKKQAAPMKQAAPRGLLLLEY